MSYLYVAIGLAGLGLGLYLAVRYVDSQPKITVKD